MNLKTDTRTIDGIEFTTQQLPALSSFALMAKLGKLLAPIIGSINGISLDSDLSSLGPALTQLFSQLDGKESQNLAREILPSTSAIIDGKQITLSTPEAINYVFSGKLKTMLLVLKFSLEVNFSDFLSELPAKLNVKNPPANLSTSMTTSPVGGLYGDSGLKVKSR